MIRSNLFDSVKATCSFKLPISLLQTIITVIYTLITRVFDVKKAYFEEPSYFGLARSVLNLSGKILSLCTSIFGFIDVYCWIISLLTILNRVCWNIWHEDVTRGSFLTSKISTIRNEDIFTFSSNSSLIRRLLQFCLGKM